LDLTQKAQKWPLLVLTEAFQIRLSILLIQKLKKTVFTSTIGKAENVEEWMLDKSYYKADFSSFKKPGNYKITIKIADQIYNSANFSIEENILAKRTISSIVHYYNKQRANTPEELEADKKCFYLEATKKSMFMADGAMHLVM